MKTKPKKEDDVQTFDISKVEPQVHEFEQRGNRIVCTIPNHNHSAGRVPEGQMLSRDDEGRYVFVPEHTVIIEDVA